jgi:hypothetical protein
LRGPLPNGGGADDIEIFQYRDYLAKDVSMGLYGSNVVTKKSVFEQAGGLHQSTPTTFQMDLLDTMLWIGVYGPCVVVKRPATIAYRVHKTNSVRNIQGVANDVFPIIEAERRGQYPGGPSRRFERYACIGGVAWCWFQLRAGGSSGAYCGQLHAPLQPDDRRGRIQENLGMHTRVQSPRVRASWVGKRNTGKQGLAKL